MYWLENGGQLIDTPGIKGFGTVDMEEDEISHYFKEIFKTSKKCRFTNCIHINEPDCAVLEAVKNHHISTSRYQSYLSMMSDLTSGKYR
jgi:ribosome biogenesis GTPase